MPYTVREKDGKWEVVKPDGTVYRTYPSKEYAEDRAEDLQERDDARSHRSSVDDRMSRLATKDLSDEEIVAKYRSGELSERQAAREQNARNLEESGKQQSPDKVPPPPPEKVTPNVSVEQAQKKKGYWARYGKTPGTDA